jgi:hypothetical protein
MTSVEAAGRLGTLAGKRWLKRCRKRKPRSLQRSKEKRNSLTPPPQERSSRDHGYRPSSYGRFVLHLSC